MSLPENIEEYGVYISSGVGKGWWPVIETLHNSLVGIDPEYRIDQIKEKFGGLRYYYSPSRPYDTPETQGMGLLVDFAEAICSRMCETCGRPGKGRTGGWIVTLCDECFTKTNE